MRYILLAIVGLAGLAYAVQQGRHARRDDLSEAEKASIRRTRERAMARQRDSAAILLAMALLLLVLGHVLPALVLGLAALTAWWSARYLHALLRP